MKNKGKYSTNGLIETEFEPGSGNRVLKNLLGVKSKRLMDNIESDALLEAEEKCIRLYSGNHHFTIKDICYNHHLFLGKIYPWAGKYRNVNLTKGSFTFASARHIPQLMTDFEKNFLHKYTPCNFKDREQVIGAIALVHTELLLIHPFREGNGRLARLLADLMALQSGLPTLDFGFVKGKTKLTYYQAVQQGMRQDYEPMKRIIRRTIQRALRRTEL